MSNCKNSSLSFFSIAKPTHEREKNQTQAVVVKNKPPFLKVHGNILYNFNYRSYIDTPFAQQDVMQHMVQSNFNFTIKDKYPVKVVLTNRSSNSPYFLNATDVNVQFSQRQLLDNIKADLKTKVNKLVDVQQLTNIEQLYKNKQANIQQLQAWISSPARVQEIVEEKEKQLRSSIPSFPNKIKIPQENFSTISNEVVGVKEKFGTPQQLFLSELKIKKEKLTDSLKQKYKDSLQNSLANKMEEAKDSSITQKIATKKQELAKLKSDLKKEEASVKQSIKNVADSINKLKSEINSLKSANGLYAFVSSPEVRPLKS